MDISQICMGCMEVKGAVEVCPKCSWSDTFSVQPQFYLPPRSWLQNRFLAGRALGYGGCGVTYLAWDTHHDTKAVVKEYLPGGMITRSFGNPMTLILTPELQPVFDHGLSLFVREMESLQGLGPLDFLPASLAVFRQNGTAYHVTEWLDGMDFATYLKRHPAGIQGEIALRMLLPAVEGLSTVHRAGLLHENIAPSNIFLTRSAQLKILDFGHARRFLRRQVPRLEFGIKDGFAAEEQYRPDGSVGPWTDMYSIGAVFYFALTGRIPPPAPERQARDSLVPLPGTYTDIQGAVTRAVHVHARQRFATMDDFKGALTGLGMSSPGPEPPTGPAPVSNFPVESTQNSPDVTPLVPEAERNAPNMSRWLAATAVLALIAVFVVAYRVLPPSVTDLRFGNSSKHQTLAVKHFAAQPAAVQAGDRATLRWKVEAASNVTINGVQVPLEGQTTVKPGSYQLIAYNDEGEKREAIQIVAISGAR